MTWKKTETNKVRAIRERLNGSIHLILGNHDREAVEQAGFAWVGDYKRVTVDRQPIVLFHYPIRSWHGVHRGAWHLHGHSHGSLADIGGYYLDVGVDVHGFRPISFAEVKAFMSGRFPQYVDHHVPDEPEPEDITLSTESSKP